MVIHCSYAGMIAWCRTYALGKVCTAYREDRESWYGDYDPWKDEYIGRALTPW